MGRLKEYKDSYKIVDAKEASDLTKYDFENSLNRDWDLLGSDCGIHDLNLVTNGFQGGKVITVAARSGVGKSAFTIQMISAGAKESRYGKGEYLYLSYEMTSQNITERLVSHYTGIPIVMITQASKLLTESQKKTVRESFAKARKIPITYQLMSLDSQQMSSIIRLWDKDVKDKEKEDKIKRNRIVFLDYIGLARLEGNGIRTYAIGELMLSLKQIANELNITIVVLAQIRRDVDKEGKPPTSESIQDSASIEQTSDVMLALHRPEILGQETMELPGSEEQIPSKGKMLMRILKNRGGSTGDFILNADMRFSRFWSLDHVKDYDYTELYRKPEFWSSLYNVEIPEEVKSMSSKDRQDELPF